MKVDISREEVERLCEVGTPLEVASARTAIIAKKKDIETQLVSDKSLMLEDRAALFLEDGITMREAQARATAASDHEWRRRAVSAQKYCDVALTKLKARLTSLHLSNTDKVAVFHGHADQIADGVRSLIADGFKVNHICPIGAESAIVVYRLAL